MLKSVIKNLGETLKEKTHIKAVQNSAVLLFNFNSTTYWICYNTKHNLQQKVLAQNRLRLIFQTKT